MTSGGFLVPPSEEQQGSEIWDETWKRVDPFLPNLFAEIFPEVKEPVIATTTEGVNRDGNPPLAEPAKVKAEADQK